jgi:hypothetical protein
MSANVAATSNTRIESGAKHVLPCKVSSSFYMDHINNNGRGSPLDIMMKYKDNYAVHKDDLVIGITKSRDFPDLRQYTTPGYASCISTLGDMTATQLQATVRWLGVHRFATAISALYSKNSPQWEKFKEDNPAHNMDPKDTMPAWYFLGVALTTAYAHPNSGDNVCSVMVSGLRTIRNGPFEINTNDTLQWIWDTEKDIFDANGSFLPHEFENIVEPEKSFENPLTKKTPDSTDRTSHFNANESKNKRRFAEMQSGRYPMHIGKKNIAVLKPYMPSFRSQEADQIKEAGGNNELVMITAMDWFDYNRIIGRAMSNAKPYEMVDILISSQSL